MNEDAFSMLQHDLERMVRSDDTDCTARDDELEQQLQQQRVMPQTVLPPLESLFRMYGLPCFYRGELVAVCGKAKSGKTFFLSLLMACTLKQKVLALERAAEQPYKVLWLDTEQSAQSTQDILLHRIMPLAEQKQLEGKKVEFGDLGTFYLAVKTIGAAKEEDFNMGTNIKGLYLRFAPSRKDINDLSSKALKKRASFMNAKELLEVKSKKKAGSSTTEP